MERDVAEDERGGEISSRLNWLRAGVLSANDGIVSTAGLVVGVAGVTVSTSMLLVSGVAGIAAGAMSMAVGEYVSVSSQRDSEKAELDNERRELAHDPEYGLVQLTDLVRAQGIDRELAHRVAVQLTERDALTAHARLELGIDPRALVNPWHAAWASLVSFVLGSIIPLLAILLSPRVLAVLVTVVAVLLTLALTGTVSAHLGRAPKPRAVVRNVLGGALAMAVTYGIGAAIGTGIHLAG